MTTDQNQSVKDDVAFLRALVERPTRPDVAAGAFMLFTGLVWAFDSLVMWTKYAGFLPMTRTQEIAFVTVVGLVYVAGGVWMRWGGSKHAPPLGVAARGFDAACRGVGLGMLMTLVVFVAATARWRIGEVFLVYPSMMFIGFGAVWFAAYIIWRRAWRLAMALGWFAGAVAMVLSPSAPYFIAIAGLAMLLLMALPGAIMIHEARKETRS
jgi:hypothetical protein